MKIALSKALFVVILTLAALIGLQKPWIQSAKAVEIETGTTTQTVTTRSAKDREAVVADPWQAVAPGESGQVTAPPQTAAGRLGAERNLPALGTFIQQVLDGQADSVRGLYIPGVLALRVVQQPDGQFDFISYDENTATQYQSPSLFGVIGLLAHNFLSGRFFFEIVPGQMLTIIYGDGQTEEFQVTQIHDYQRLAELDLHSDFLDLQNNQTLTADQVFQLYYQGDRHLTLQTCLERDGNLNWGIRMITALPTEAAP